MEKHDNIKGTTVVITTVGGATSMNDIKNATVAQSDLSAVYQALNRVQAIVEFEVDGTVISEVDLGHSMDT